jgi:hypothetical protein
MKSCILPDPDMKGKLLLFLLVVTLVSCNPLQDNNDAASGIVRVWAVDDGGFGS